MKLSKKRKYFTSKVKTCTKNLEKVLSLTWFSNSVTEILTKNTLLNFLLVNHINFSNLAKFVILLYFFQLYFFN